MCCFQEVNLPQSLPGHRASEHGWEESGQCDLGFVHMQATISQSEARELYLMGRAEVGSILKGEGKFFGFCPRVW